MLKSKKIILIMLVALLAICTLAFVACDPTPEATEGEKAVTIIIGDDIINTTTDALYVHDLLVELDVADAIEYEYELGAYGATVMKLNSLVTTSDWTQWVGVYHDIDDVTLYTPGYDITINGDAYFSSSVGVSSLIVVDGATYVFVQG